MRDDCNDRWRAPSPLEWVRTVASVVSMVVLALHYGIGVI